jgi:hypothetical protein
LWIAYNHRPEGGDLSLGCAEHQKIRKTTTSFGAALSRFLSTPVLPFVLLVALRLIRVTGWAEADYGPFSFMDELVYKLNAQSIFDGAQYYSFHYPPLYPLSLSPAFLFREYWYESMLFINAIVSSTVVFPAWWLARKFLTVRQSWLAVFVVALLPYGIAYPTMIWSENLFVPLLFLAVYVGFGTELGRARSSYLFGLAVAAMWATRYIALVLIPVFGALWLWRVLLQRPQPSPGRNSALALAGGVATVLIPWILYGLFSSEPLTRILFAKYSLSNISSSATLTVLTLWIAAYCSYLLLAAGPVLSWAILTFTDSGHRTREAQLLLFSGSIVCALIAVAAYHSWRHDYNYPEPYRLLGRYLTVGMPLIFAAGTVALVRLTEKGRRKGSFHVVSVVGLSTGLVLLSRAVIFGGLLHRFRPDFATSFNSPDVFGRDSWWVISLILVATASPLFWLVRGKLGRQLARAFWFASTCAVLLFCGTLVANRIDARGSVGRHARVLARTWQRLGADDSKRISIVEDIPTSEISARLLAFGVQFFGMPGSVGVSNQRGCAEATSDLVLRVSGIPPPERPLASYRVSDRTYYVSVDELERSEAMPCILSWGAMMTIANVGFNVQPNGESAMWMKGRNFTPETRVRFGNQTLRPQVSNSSFLTFLVPPELYALPGRYPIYLYQADSGLKSDPVWFRVKPE